MGFLLVSAQKTCKAWPEGIGQRGWYESRQTGSTARRKHSSCTKELEKEWWAGHSDGLGKAPHTARGARWRWVSCEWGRCDRKALSQRRWHRVKHFREIPPCWKHTESSGSWSQQRGSVCFHGGLQLMLVAQGSFRVRQAGSTQLFLFSVLQGNEMPQLLIFPVF